MKIVRVGELEIHVPEPLYLLPSTLSVQQQEIRGVCLFPSGDPSVGDRVDHVNIAHELFVVWNCGHVFAAVRGWRRLRAHEVAVRAFREVSPDTPVEFQTILTDVRIAQGYVVGAATATFSKHGQPLVEVLVQKFSGKVAA